MRQLVLGGCAFAAFYILAQPLAHLLGIPDRGGGTPAKIAAILTFILCLVIGTIVGMFLIPVVLRPFVTSDVFWDFINAKYPKTTTGLERSVKLLDRILKVFDPLMERWAVFLYGRCNRDGGR